MDFAQMYYLNNKSITIKYLKRIIFTRTNFCESESDKMVANDKSKR